MASNLSPVAAHLTSDETEKQVDHSNNESAPSFDSHYYSTSLSSLYTGYSDVPELLERRPHKRDDSKFENDIPILGPPPTTVYFPEITAKLTPNASRVSGQSSISGSDWEILKSALQSLVKDHGKVASSRFFAQQKRRKLQQKRTISTDLGAALMRELNAFFAKEGTSSPIFALFEQYQSSWSEYLAIENEYNNEEDNLDDIEFQLEETQENLKNVVERYDTKKSVIADLVPLEDQENAVSGLAFEGGVYHPLMAKYLSRRGALELAKERLWDLRVEHKEVYEDYKIGGSSQLDEDAVDLLTNFRKYEDEILREREELEAELEQLKMQCDKQGLNEDIPTSHTLDSEVSLSDPLQSLESLPAHKHVLWGRGSPRFFETAIQKAPIDTGAYINKWIYHQLCQSSLEVLHLKQSLGAQNLKIDNDEQLRDLALRYWTFDGAAKPVFRAFSEPSSDRSNEPRVRTVNVGATDNIETKATENVEPNSADNIELAVGTFDTEAVGNKPDSAENIELATDNIESKVVRNVKSNSAESIELPMELAIGNSEIMAVSNEPNSAENIEATDNTESKAAANIEMDAADNFETNATGNIEVEAPDELESKVIDNTDMKSIDFDNIETKTTNNIELLTTGNIESKSTNDIKLAAADTIELTATEYTEPEPVDGIETKAADNFETESTIDIKMNATDDIMPKTINDLETNVTKNMRSRTTDDIEATPRPNYSLYQRRYSSLVDFNGQPSSPGRRQASPSIFCFDRPFLSIT
ncbi:hypothetical protein FQN49_001686 [Arthroderma sp. PD_2]|nr:hypothetical protein FQN49_001686 [Arthroderma sp. PD_2]